jgi:hypothetical protein
LLRVVLNKRDNIFYFNIKNVFRRFPLLLAVLLIVISFFFPMAPQPLWVLAAYFSFLIYTRAIGLLERVISSSQGLYLTHDNTNTGKHIHTPLNIHAPKAGFEPAITASERSKTVHALDRSATATGHCHF